ncbi:MAG: LCP family protein [Chloroflexi bacterium]|nr:LCP family protein [Chloroflexota bacterium]
MKSNEATRSAPGISSDLKPWDGKARVTVLVMGLDHRQGEIDPARTDSLILFTLDPQSMTGGMLSIPRDMWVDIPGSGKDKITTAHYEGEIFKLPGGGPALAVKTVENFIGVPIQYYVRINFTAFETLVDEIGGIDINNPEDISDPTYPDSQYGYEPFYLPAGQQHLNGHDTLRYARTRHTPGGDFDRARRQQQVVMVVRQKILSLNMLPTLIQKSPTLYQALADGITTNLSLDQMVRLALLAQQIPDGNIHSAVIDSNYVELGISPDGLDILKPIPGKIRELREQIFASDGPYAPVVVQSNEELLKGEAARVSIENGTFTAGLAALAADYLRGKGVNVVEVTNADRRDYATTVIVDYTGKPYTVRWLAEAMHVSGSIFSGSEPGSAVDVVVIVGSDWRPP